MRWWFGSPLEKGCFPPDITLIGCIFKIYHSKYPYDSFLTVLYHWRDKDITVIILFLADSGYLAIMIDMLNASSNSTDDCMRKIGCDRTDDSTGGSDSSQSLTDNTGIKAWSCLNKHMFPGGGMK